MSNRNPIRLAVLISGGGRSVLNLQRRIEQRMLDARIEVVVSSRADAPGVEKARSAGLHVVVVDRKSLTPAQFQAGITEAVRGVDLVVMAGFLSFWQVPDHLMSQVINIHPALLPDFGGKGMYGIRVHEAVLRGGRTESGCTVHYCDNQYDHGPILLQRKVPVLASDTPDTLAARVFEAECEALPEAIAMWAARHRVPD